MKYTLFTSLFLALAAASPTALQRRQGGFGSAPVGETHSGVQLNPHDNYGAGPRNPILATGGACGNRPPNDANPLFFMDEARGDMKVSLSGQTPGGFEQYCGKKIRITGKNGAQADAHIVDVCPGCPPFGMDLMKDVWLKVGNGPETGPDVITPIQGASWVIIE